MQNTKTPVSTVAHRVKAQRPERRKEKEMAPIVFPMYALFTDSSLNASVSAGWLRRICKVEEIALVIVTAVLSAAIVIFMLTPLPLMGSWICLGLWGAALGTGAPSSTVVLAQRSDEDKGVVLAFAETMNNIVIFTLLPLASFALEKRGIPAATLVLAGGLAIGLLLTLLDAGMYMSKHIVNPRH